MSSSREFQRALAEGSRRSLAASAPRPADSRAGAPAPREALTPEVLWRRFMWLIVGGGLFLLMELLSLSKLVSTMGTHF